MPLRACRPQRSRHPPPPPPPRPPPKPPPPRRWPPPEPAGFAISTLIWRPSRSVPLRRDTAAVASSFVAISTKPKPRDRPVSRSVTTVGDWTSPKPAKASRRRSFDVEKERPPTKSLTAMGLVLYCLPPRARPERGRSWGRGLPVSWVHLNRLSTGPHYCSPLGSDAT